MNEEQRKEMEAMAGDMAKKIVAGLGLEKIADLSDKVEKLMSKDSVVDSKMVKILGGKDYLKDADKLTKNEKIVGFFHAYEFLIFVFLLCFITLLDYFLLILSCLAAPSM